MHEATAENTAKPNGALPPSAHDVMTEAEERLNMVISRAADTINAVSAQAHALDVVFHQGTPLTAEDSGAITHLIVGLKRAIAKLEGQFLELTDAVMGEDGADV